MASPIFPAPKKNANLRTNVYLDRSLKSEAAKIARIRYGFSTSRLINGLLYREVNLKGGLLNAKLATR